MEQSVNQTLRVGQLATKVGKTVRTIHFYEELGLLSPASRSKGGFRLYDSEALTRIHWIERLQQIGFSLTDIRDFLSDFQGISSGPQAMDKLQRFYREKLDETRAAIARHQALEVELQESLEFLIGCGCCDTDTPRSACGSCDLVPDTDDSPPVLIAALTESA
jgi:MerR family Zn(II)-responsive transcriptional regulator of zntA